MIILCKTEASITWIWGISMQVTDNIPILLKSMMVGENGRDTEDANLLVTHVSDC